MRRLLTLIATLMISGGVALSQTPAPTVQGEPQAQPSPQIERLDESRIKLGPMIIDRRLREVTLPAKINLTRGILEYYAVSSGGKLHEAILEVGVEPSQLHLALILAGFEPSEYGPQDPKTYQRPLLKKGSLLRLYVKWTPASLGRAQWLPASVWLFDRSVDNAPQPLTYVFQGSVMSQGKYMGDLDRSVIGLIPDETVVLAADEDKGNPYRGDSNGYEAHTSAIPTKGTEVELVIRPAGPQSKEEVEGYVQALKQIKEAQAKEALKASDTLPPAPPFIINLPSSPFSSKPYRDLP